MEKSWFAILICAFPSTAPCPQGNWFNNIGCYQCVKKPTLRLGPISHTGTVKWDFLNKRALYRLSTDSDSVMSDDGESDE